MYIKAFNNRYQMLILRGAHQKDNVSNERIFF